MCASRSLRQGRAGQNRAGQSRCFKSPKFASQPASSRPPPRRAQKASSTKMIPRGSHAMVPPWLGLTISPRAGPCHRICAGVFPACDAVCPCPPTGRWMARWVMTGRLTRGAAWWMSGRNSGSGSLVVVGRTDVEQGKAGLQARTLGTCGRVMGGTLLPAAQTGLTPVRPRLLSRWAASGRGGFSRVRVWFVGGGLDFGCGLGGLGANKS